MRLRKTFPFIVAFGLIIPTSRIFGSPPTQPSTVNDPPAALADSAVAPQSIGLLDDDGDDDDKPKTPVLQSSTETSSRFYLGLLDHRSNYGNDFFPDLFLGPEMDKETQLEIDYLHGEKRNFQDNEVDGELEWNPIGQLTLEGELGWDSQHRLNPSLSSDADDVEQGSAGGLEQVDLALIHPVFQYVSKDGVLDYTAAFRFDVGIPTRTPASGTDLQLMPYLGHLIRIGDHVSVQAWTGAQITIAPHQTNQFVYGVSLGYQIVHSQLPFPLTNTITPLFELDGQRPFSNHGQDALFGVAGLNWQIATGEKLNPRLGLGYQFPIDQGARDQLSWGIITQLFLEF